MNLRLPTEWQTGTVAVLDVLAWLNASERRGPTLAMLMGAVDTRIFQAFLDGISFLQLCSGQEDREYEAFCVWLRESGVSTIGGGWWEPLLARNDGDQLKAIEAYLRLAADYRRSRQR